MPTALDEAAIMLDEVERALAVAHAAEVKVERTGAFLLRVGVILLGLVVGGEGVLLLRWLLEHRSPSRRQRSAMTTCPTPWSRWPIPTINRSKTSEVER